MKKTLSLIKKILELSIDELIERDSDIFNHAEEVIDQLSGEEVIRLNRKLHETTINHRLAFYLEKYCYETELEDLIVDIEYNRYYENPKMLNTIEGRITARPDIIMHSRMDKTVPTQHFLVVEAKKELITEHDRNKIRGFISDDDYTYLFGLTISYCQDPNNVIATLFYYNGENIIEEDISRHK
ncbi:hypothetical protein [Flavobacterium sp.]|uniref:hypothetical protein n=1 Tax=Flavobacterium sp. TaxID=239 RepID=UPI0025B96937|nr:hypothetical protein [Flavobacterium sp.]MBA4154830.1 hypothetical protein [Flavobacterium sp.]MDP2161246.1 hypothetical protein [Flavobacterium sp.]